MIAAVGFDLGETLLHYAGIPLNWQTFYRQALLKTWEACVRTEDTPAVSEEDLSHAEVILGRYNTRLNPRTIEVPATRILSEVLACWEIAGNVTTQAEEAFFGYFQQTVALYDDTLPLLQLLRVQGIKIGVLTDVPYGMSRRFVERDLEPIAPFLDVCLTSVEIGHRKPAPNGFRALAAALEVPTSRMLYVGNEPKDIEGAKAAGITAVLLAREGQVFPDYGQARTISSLHELSRLVSGEVSR